MYWYVLFMFSWMLWRTLLNPPLKHPIFHRAHWVASPKSIRSRRTRHILTLITLMTGVLAAKLLNINLFVALVSLPILLVMGMMISPLLLPFAIFGFGAFVATRISYSVFMEKQNATYDLLHLPPIQIIRADWLLATGVLYRGHAFELLNQAVNFTMLGAAVLILILIATFWANGYAIVLTELVNMVALLALFYTGYIQSIVLSIILGLLVPQYAANVDQNRFNAAFAYLIVQSGIYLLALFIRFSVLPRLYAMLNFDNQWANASVTIVCVLFTYGLREWIIAALWHYLVYTLNDDTVSLTNDHTHCTG